MKVKKSNAISIGIIAVLVAMVVMLFIKVYVPSTSITGDVQNAGVQSTGSFDKFEGVIINTANLAPQTLQGTASTDEGCQNAGNGLVNCFSDIVTSQGTLRFNYKHDMNAQPCLAMNGPEQVTINILDSNGNAEVIRTSSSGGMIMNH